MCGPAAETEGGGWFSGGAEAVRNDRGDVEVQPPEEHTCRHGHPAPQFEWQRVVHNKSLFGEHLMHVFLIVYLKCTARRRRELAMTRLQNGGVLSEGLEGARHSLRGQAGIVDDGFGPTRRLGGRKHKPAAAKSNLSKLSLKNKYFTWLKLLAMSEVFKSYG